MLGQPFKSNITCRVVAMMMSIEDEPNRLIGLLANQPNDFLGQRDGAGGLQAHRGPGDAVPPPRSRQQAAGRMPFGAGRVGEFLVAKGGGIGVAIRVWPNEPIPSKR